MKYEKHIFVCGNQRPEGAARPCCGEENAKELITAFNKAIKEYNVEAQVSMRVQRSNCFDTCELGPSVVVYPDGVFYGRVHPEDAADIVKEHLIGGRVVERLRMNMNELNRLQGKA